MGFGIKTLIEQPVQLSENVMIKMNSIVTMRLESFNFHQKQNKQKNKQKI